MDQIVTIAERKARSAARRRAAIDAAIAELRGYATDRGGRYLIFGSAAKGKVRGTSDLDVIVDFPPDGAPDAFAFAEEVCSRFQIPCDPQYMPSKSTAFIERVREHAIVLP